MDRRSVLKRLTAVAAATTVPVLSSARGDAAPGLPTRHLKKIATEEAFTIPEIAEAFRSVIKKEAPTWISFS